MATTTCAKIQSDIHGWQLANTRKINVLKGILLHLIFHLFVQSGTGQFKISGEYRPRWEFRDGYKMPLADSLAPALIITQRSRISIDYSSNKIITSFSLQDVRAWGEERIKTDNASLGIFEAWMQLPVINTLDVKIGRQQLYYDDQRILGRTNWNNAGTTHDAFLLKYETEKSSWHLAGAYNNDSRKDLFNNGYSLNFYKTMGVARFARKFKSSQLSILTVFDGYEKSGNHRSLNNRFTFGPFMKGTWNDFSIDGSIYLQRGKHPSGVDVKSHFYSLAAGYKLNNGVRINLGTNYYSGNDERDDTDNVDHTFDILYGARHKYLGYMDYFPHQSNGGLTNYFFRTTGNIIDNVSFELTYHNFNLNAGVLDRATAKEDDTIHPYLGSEVDISLKYNHGKNVELTLYYSSLLSTESMNIIQKSNGGCFSQWLSIMLTYKPVFFEANN